MLSREVMDVGDTLNNGWAGEELGPLIIEQQYIIVIC
jgi:hypothetical protein